VSGAATSGSTEYQDLRIERLAPATHPWAIAFVGDGRLLVSEREGRLFLVENGQRTQVSGVPEVHARNQGGLLDVVAHPDFASNGWVYMTYSHGAEDRTTTASAVRGWTAPDWSISRNLRHQRVGRSRAATTARASCSSATARCSSVGDRMRNPERAQDPRTTPAVSCG
jgi:aldose sugar dehydrogenase